MFVRFSPTFADTLPDVRLLSAARLPGLRRFFISVPIKP